MKWLQLVNAVAIEAATPTKDIERVLAAYRLTILRNLRVGDVIVHKNFATYYVTKRAARSGLNPRTHQPIAIPAKKRASARLAKSAHDFLL